VQALRQPWRVLVADGSTCRLRGGVRYGPTRDEGHVLRLMKDEGEEQHKWQ